MKLNETAATVLTVLRETEYENSWTEDGHNWLEIYLDNARVDARVRHLKGRAWASALSVLSKAGLYKVDDGYAFGFVRMT
ncbi:hypothetical protein [Mesorhizobium sp. A623]